MCCESGPQGLRRPLATLFNSKLAGRKQQELPIMLKIKSEKPLSISRSLNLDQINNTICQPQPKYR